MSGEQLELLRDYLKAQEEQEALLQQQVRRGGGGGRRATLVPLGRAGSDVQPVACRSGCLA